MDNQPQHNNYKEEIDVSTFLEDLSRGLLKEGDALRAFAEIWFTRGDDESEILIQAGIDLAKKGRQLLALRDQFCNACLTKVVVESLYFGDSDKEKVTGQQ